MPILEAIGLIDNVGTWLLERALVETSRWTHAEALPIRVAVNVSPLQLRREEFADDVLAALARAGADPRRLELEVTESTLMTDPSRAAAVLGHLRERGVTVAIDDFGTGYSSLAHLKRFPIDTLKVDRSFIREVPNDAEDKAIAEAIIAMGKTLSLTVVAEGVETPQQQAFLSERLCDEMQGYYFSTPVAAQDFAELLHTHEPKPLR